MQWIARVTDAGGLEFAKAVQREHFRAFCKANPKAYINIEPRHDASGQMHRFFEGAVVKYFALQHCIGNKPMEYDDAREILKEEYNPMWYINRHGDRVKTGGSIADLKRSRSKFLKFIETILAEMRENGMQVPDSEEYKKWEQSAPLAGEEYPPVKRLIHMAEQRCSGIIKASNANYADEVEVGGLLQINHNIL